MSDLSADEKKKVMGQMKEMMEMKNDRNSKFDDHDFQQMIKNGFFDKMSKGERDEYDKMDKKMRDERKGNFSKMDDKMEEFKKSGGFDKMSADDKKDFMNMFMFQMGGNMQQMMKDREDDDDMRKK